MRCVCYFFSAVRYFSTVDFACLFILFGNFLVKMKLGKSVSLKYDEKSDEWIESYDSYSAEDEFEDEVLGDDDHEYDTNNKEKSSSDNDDSVSDSDNNDEGDISNENKLKSNPGWADAMSKILKSKKPNNQKYIVLSKAKKIKDVKPKKAKLDFEIVGAENDEDGKPSIEELDDKKDIFGKKLSMKEYQIKGRVKPSVLDKDRERTLMKIATKGVVQLFNAVRQQQKIVDKTIKKAGKSQLKRERVLESIDKKKFLDVLTGSAKSISLDNEIISNENQNKQKCTWGVLRDDFMMGAKLKDWDKKEESS